MAASGFTIRYVDLPTRMFTATQYLYPASGVSTRTPRQQRLVPILTAKQIEYVRRPVIVTQATATSGNGTNRQPPIFIRLR